MIDLKEIRAAAEAATPIYTDLLGDRYFGNDHSTATLTKAQDDFISTANPATVTAMCNEIERLTACLKKANDQAEHFEREWYLRGERLEAAEKDAARKVIRVKLGDQYGNDINGHWFYLHPADDEAQKVLDNRVMKK